MKLLVDSGSTKADWISIDGAGNVLFTTQTLGLNPEVLTKEEIIARINENFDIFSNKKEVTHLYFYGAGCGTDRMKNFLQELFQVYFINAEVVVFEDTYAAVYATTPPNEKAIVCILGTGSNCSYFDGEKLHQKVQSLGYIIMDDCSGNQFGRQLIRDYYFNKMPKFLSDQFEQNYNLEADVIKHNLYKEPNPNAYMATFAQFLIEHKKQDYCQKVIATQIEIFVENYITQFENYKEVPIHFIGSIAFYLKEELKQIFDKKGLQLGNVIKRPIEGLIRFHTLECK